MYSLLEDSNALEKNSHMNKKEFIINVYEVRLKELKIFNLNKDIVKSILDNVKKMKPDVFHFLRPEQKKIYILEKGIGTLDVRPVQTVELEAWKLGSIWVSGCFSQVLLIINIYFL